jgi:hypothetical protein
VDELAQLVLLILVAAIVVNLVTGGWPAVGAWFRSKFLGQQTAAAVGR